jgi:Cu2+-exporting ATPase
MTGHTGHGEPGAHDRHEGHSVAMFRDRFWITLLLSIPTLLWSGMVQHMFGFSAPTLPGSPFIPALFGTAVYFYGGLVFVKGGLREVRDRRPGMMTLISLAITVAFVFSLAVTLGYPGEALWWELASLVTIMLLGHWIEMRSISQASGALRELARLLPSTANASSAKSSKMWRSRRSVKATSCSCDQGRACQPMASCRAARAT